MSKGAIGYPSANMDQVYDPFFQNSCVNYSNSTHKSSDSQKFQAPFSEMRNFGNGLKCFENIQSENRFQGRAEGKGRHEWDSNVDSPKLVHALMTMMSEYETKEKQNRKKIFISNLPREMSDFEIKDLFEKNFGKVETACRAKPRFRQLEPFGFVTFSYEEAARCCIGRRAVFYRGRKIHCSPYVEKKKFNKQPKKERKYYGERNSNRWSQEEGHNLNPGSNSRGSTGRLPDPVYYQLKNRQVKMGMRIRALDDKPTLKSYWNFLRGTNIFSHNLKEVNYTGNSNIRLNRNENSQIGNSPYECYSGLGGQF